LNAQPRGIAVKRGIAPSICSNRSRSSPIAGIDLSPMAAIIGLVMLEMLVVPLLDTLMGVPRFL